MKLCCSHRFNKELTGPIARQEEVRLRAGPRVHWEEGWGHQSDGEEAAHVEDEVMSM